MGIQNTGLYKLTADSNRDINFFYISYQNFEEIGIKIIWATRIGTIKQKNQDPFNAQCLKDLSG